MRVPAVVPIPAGRFAMGSVAGRPDEAPVHEVAVRAFGLTRTPVSNAEYAVALAAGAVPAPPWWGRPGYDDAAQPVVGLSWFDATAFAAWLSRETGDVWRLPTEAEWEWAMRGGLRDAPTAWGAALPPGEVPDGPLEGPWPVGRGTPNGFGVLDPGTLVHEWCQDWYDAGYYGVSPAADPTGPEEGVRRASRGGSWRHRVRWSPPAARSSLPPDFHYADYGVRLAMLASAAAPGPDE